MVRLEAKTESSCIEIKEIIKWYLVISLFCGISLDSTWNKTNTNVNV